MTELEDPLQDVEKRYKVTSNSVEEKDCKVEKHRKNSAQEVEA